MYQDLSSTKVTEALTVFHRHTFPLKELEQMPYGIVDILEAL